VPGSRTPSARLRRGRRPEGGGRLRAAAGHRHGYERATDMGAGSVR